MLGALGFAAFNLLAYSGLQRAQPQSVALVSALGPLVTALVVWGRSGVRPARSTLVWLGVALVGVTLVISRGNPASILDGAIGSGDALVLGGVVSFVLYTLGAVEFPELSPLRYTALTAALGWLATGAATAVATVSGLEPEPSAAAVGAVLPQLAYITLLGAVVAVLTWNTAVGIIGAQNVALFGNLIPVTTFAIEIVRGYRPGAVELAGAGLGVGALAASNLAGRGTAREAPAAAAEPVPEPALRQAA